MTTTTAAGLDPAEQYAADRNRLWVTATAALTAAAKLTHPTGHQLDFADFLADALAAVTANLGGVEELLAGRSGSWEAALVDQLVNGTLGYDPTDAELIRRRTEPVTVTAERRQPGRRARRPRQRPLHRRPRPARRPLRRRHRGRAGTTRPRRRRAAPRLDRPLHRLRRPVHRRRARRRRPARRHRPRHGRDQHRPRQRLRRARQHRRPRLGRPAHRPARLAALAGRPRRPPDRRTDRPSDHQTPATGSGAATGRSPAPPGA